MKEYRCRKSPADIAPMIDVWRGDEPVAVITLRHHVPEEIMGCARNAAFGYDADVMVVLFETYEAKYDPDKPGHGFINPMTGKEWERGELSDAAQNHDGIARGWVIESIGVSAVNRAGDVAYRALRYRYSGKHLVWEDDLSSIDVDEPVGLMPDYLRDAMNDTSISTILPEHIIRLDREERDATTSAVLQEKFQCQAMLLSRADNENRVRALRRFGVPL